MKNKTLLQKIREGINKPIGKAVLATALLGGCRANYTKPTYVTKMGEDSVETYKNQIRANLMKVFKKDGTEIRCYDNQGGWKEYFDKIEINYPDSIKKVYKNRCTVKDEYDTLFISATNYWQRVNNKREREKAEQLDSKVDSALKLLLERKLDPEIDSVLKLIKGK